MNPVMWLYFSTFICNSLSWPLKILSSFHVMGTFLIYLGIDSFFGGSVHLSGSPLLGCFIWSGVWDCLGAVETRGIGSTEKLIGRSKSVSSGGFVF